ncbi:3-deoxy-7-phosphoheptulonate synthase [Cellulomonas bogoriensis]|uniref:Phospho-2-dehydro-3-deoxyheptonate aldolase n=1 Tax=Cellulomonas bogoriensis 69B4 = DSM 16987 TaxID=1386082 RepID=A0A0A0BYN5_9CELL|nr:3-deoxy-7-phosphoheptulonate synthase [Cellulomonas bogoriensis]KGM13523.1 phospho-2-dehydro-3-deoxyheptonate aldolase [Cellulomonas bogoriensis 69B4 = DSM 16987]
MSTTVPTTTPTSSTAVHASTADLRVRSVAPLPSPRAVVDGVPLTAAAAELVARSRAEVRAVLHGGDDRLVVVVGPCAVHDPVAALDYAHRLRGPAREHAADLVVVMRVYFEKPRTTVGWKGLINDPSMDGSHDVPRGLRLAREVVTDVLGAGLPTACEFLEPTSPQYLADAVTWGAIGARNPESQVHRQMASGMSMPIGFKNSTGGRVRAAVEGCLAAAAPHTFLGVDHDGRAAVVATEGNPDCHVVLRGGVDGPNHDPVAVAAAVEQVGSAGLPARVMVDASHGNSGKCHVRQAEVVREIADQVASGVTGVMGVMMESFLEAGRQDPAPSGLVYGRSVTDACLGWDTTADLLDVLAGAVRRRRSRR